MTFNLFTESSNSQFSNGIQAQQQQSFENLIYTYDRVERFYPQPNRMRPVVFVGPEPTVLSSVMKRIVECDGEQIVQISRSTSFFSLFFLFYRV